MALKDAIIKRGEDVLSINFRRTSFGLTVYAKSHPILEEFVKNLGDGTKRPVEAYGKAWESLTDDPIEVYNTKGGAAAGVNFRLDAPGTPMETQDGSVNLSFLRIAGIGSKEGVAFAVRGVYSDAKLKEIRDKISGATQSFYVDYIKPVECGVTVSTTPIVAANMG